MQLTDIDVFDPDIYLRGVPHEQFRFLRAHDPVHWQEEQRQRPDVDPTGYWALTKYEDLVSVSRNPTLFSSARGGTNLEDLPPAELSIIQMMMLNMDPPQHVKLRRLIKSGFTPRVIQSMQPFIESAVDEAMNNALSQGACDFVETIASEIPLILICDILGVPLEDRHKICDWTNKLIGFQDPEYPSTGEEAGKVSMELIQYALNMAQQKRGKPEHDVAGILINADIDGEKLTDMEFGMFMLLLCVAGSETTRNAMTHGLIAMLENPEQWDLFKSDPETHGSLATEEIIRWATPVMYFRRTATQDTELRGKAIKENDKVCIYYASANRDEDVFDKPYDFDITRDPNPQIAFGTGEHFCMGSSLARMEIEHLFRQLAEKMPDIQLAGPPVRLRSNFINGIKQLPVTF